jgi:glycerol-3-phosphate dehydrogenase
MCAAKRLSPVFSFESREFLVEKLQRETFDVAVVGGGITGAAVARDAAFRGLKVALLEAQDFAEGTSSGSSKLIHGGVRYLEQFEFKLVYEAIREREKLKKLYAPFVQDLSFVFPTYRDVFPPRWKLNLGLFLYDAFARFRSPHLNLSKKATLQNFPWLKPDGLTGACVYVDSFSEDFRLVTELIKSATRKGAICLSRMRVKNIQTENPFLLTLEDSYCPRPREIEVKAKSIFNCTGPYTDEIRALLNLQPALRLTQGVHFIIPQSRLPIKNAIVLPDPELHRILFAIPWNSVTYFGTTDTDIEDPSKARASKADADYVLKIINRYFNTNLTAKDFIQSWAAVRPLIKPPETRNPSEISREHKLEERPRGIFHLLGGKLTSHRVMAREALDHITMNHSVDSIPLQDEIWTKAKPTELERRWGRYAEDILQIDAESNLQQKRILGENSPLVSEILYSIHHEMALTPLDFLRRRSSLYYECPLLEVAERVTEVFSKTMNWDEETSRSNLQEINRHYEWDRGNF